MTVAEPAALATYLETLRGEVDAALERVLAGASWPAVIAEPVRYSLMGGGKRLRPSLTLAVAESCARAMQSGEAAARAQALPAACAVEMVHSYSLVHDDLPAMDDDALRRGRPTTHVVYGDGLAILAGDALLTDAFGILASWPSTAGLPGTPEPPADRRLRAVSVLASAAGALGMVGGQAIDLVSTGAASRSASPMDAAALEDMHARKTGALIRAAATLGAIMAGADDVLVSAVDLYARELGLAFQIVDDVLDVEAQGGSLGKTAGKDAAAGKPTFPSIHGLAESKRRAADCIERAKAALRSVGLTGPLDTLADWSLTRRN